MNSTEVLEELETYEHLYRYLSAHTGMTVRDPDDVQSIYSTLKAEVLIALLFLLFFDSSFALTQMKFNIKY